MLNFCEFDRLRGERKEVERNSNGGLSATERRAKR